MADVFSFLIDLLAAIWCLRQPAKEPKNSRIRRKAIFCLFISPFVLALGLVLAFSQVKLGGVLCLLALVLFALGDVFAWRYYLLEHKPTREAEQ